MQGDIDWLAEAARHDRKRQRREAMQGAGAQRPSRAFEGGEIAAILSGEQAHELADLEVLLEDIIDEGGPSSGSEVEQEQPAPMPPHSPQRGPAPAPGSSSYASPPGVLDDGRLHAVRMACISECVGWSTEEISRLLCFGKAEKPWRLVQRGPPSSGWDVAGAVLGRLTVTFGGRTLQALCSNPGHSPKCKLLLNVWGDMLATEAHLLRWLIFGVTVSRDEHLQCREAIKAEHVVKS